jgi:putative ABC transport system permease protein
MRVPDVLRLAWGALMRSRRRTGLSLSGVAVGTAAVLVLTALGEGARIYVREQFNLLGSLSVIVVPGRAETQGALPGAARAANDLTLDDAAAVLNEVPGVLRLAPMAVGNETVSYRERSRQVVVFGSTPRMLEIRDLALAEGEFLPEMPWDRGAPVAVIGASVARELFPGVSPLGAALRIGDWRMRVIGVLEPKGTHMGLDMDEVVFAPVASVMQMFDQSSLFRIALDVNAQSTPADVGRRVTELLTERHGEEDVTVLTQDAVMGALNAILGVLTLALTGIAAISLSVAGIGIMNVMLVSVSERTGEIGLLKAIGARPRQILSLFLVEAALLSSAGGVVGVLLGTAAVKLARIAYPAFPAQSPVWAVVAAVLVACLVGVVFGVWPARGAVRLDPVVALTRRTA